MKFDLSKVKAELAKNQNYADTGTFTRQEISDIFEKLQFGKGQNGLWRVINLANPVSRGVYSFSKQPQVVVAPKAKPKMKKTAPMKIASAPVVEEVNFVAPVTEHRAAFQNVQSNSNFSYVPALDPDYVKFGHHKDLEKIISSRVFFPTFITGPSGNGKSSMVMQICAEYDVPMIRMNITSQTDEEKLIGTKTLVDGNIQIVEGPMLIAMRTGCLMVLEECDAGNANTLLCLQSILEGRPFYFALSGEYITPKAGFNIIALGNTKGKGSDDGRYIGTNILNEAWLDRFAITLEQDYPTPTVELKMVLNWMLGKNCTDVKFAEDLVKWSDSIRKTYRDGGVDEIITTRRLQQIVTAYSVFGDKQKVINMTTARFDTMTSESFRMLFDKINSDVTPDPVQA